MTGRFQSYPAKMMHIILLRQNKLWQGFIQVFWEGAFFAKIGKESGHLGIKIAGVSCKICEFCMILKKLQLGMGPIFGPCEMRDKALFGYTNH